MYSKVKLPPNSNGEVALEGDLSITPKDLSEFRTLGISIKEAMQTGATGYAVGMLAGFAAQSGATSMAIFASTGTAISSLSGAAATNATLAQLGGGALSAGGLGMAGGQAVLTGLTAAPLLMVEESFLISKEIKFWKTLRILSTRHLRLLARCKTLRLS